MFIDLHLFCNSTAFFFSTIILHLKSPPHNTTALTSKKMEHSDLVAHFRLAGSLRSWYWWLVNVSWTCAFNITHGYEIPTESPFLVMKV